MLVLKQKKSVVINYNVLRFLSPINQNRVALENTFKYLTEKTTEIN